MERDEFVARFKTRLEALLPREVWVEEREYIDRIAVLTWEDELMRDDGPEECAEAEASEWGAE